MQKPAHSELAFIIPVHPAFRQFGQKLLAATGKKEHFYSSAHSPGCPLIMQTMLRPDWSRKMRFFSFVSMVLLVYVHGYDLNDRYLQPFSFVYEKMTVTTFFEYFTANGIFRFRIPMLFAISGYLLALGDSKGYGKMIGRRFRTLAIPFFLWTTLGAVIAYGLFHWSFTHQSVLNIHMQPTPKNWNEFGWRDWLNMVGSTNVTYQLWFLRSLFIMALIYPVLRYLVLRAPAVTFTVIAFLWLLTPWSPLYLLPFRGPWLALFDGEALLPFCLGIWLCKRGKNLSATPRWFSMKLFVPLFLALAIGKTVLAFYAPSFKTPEVPGIPLWLLHKLTIVTGMLVTWYGSDRLAAWSIGRRWFRHASDQAFMIYALHVPLVTYLIDPVHGLLLPYRYYRLATYLLLPLAIILAAILFGSLLKKIAPSLFGILTGDRGLKPLPVATQEVPAGAVRAVAADAPLPRQSLS
jgi:fucose 4-O-acetylase-like acetyltransferase